MINKFDGTNQGPDVDKYIEERFRVNDFFKYKGRWK